MKDLFSGVVCGIDQSPEGLEALRQAQRLLLPGGALHLVTVEEPSVAAHARSSASPLLVQPSTGARYALDYALEHAPNATSRLVEGDVVESLISEAEQVGATAIVVGSHGQSRIAGFLLGSTAVSLLRRSPVSVLVARRPRGLLEFPASILAGVDGSGESRRALEVARELGSRLRVPVESVSASGGKPVHWEGLRDVEGLRWSEQGPVNALIEMSAAADLLVLGSRGLHGLASLGSVSERVANRAFCSVLVVRD
jgi:nucleotide-binding universal stress UspA family protein